MALVRIRCLSHLNAINKRKVTLATAKQIVVADNFDNERMSNLSSEMINIYDFSISNMTSGYKNAPYSWTETFEVELPEYEQIITKIVHDFKPFYEKLHAYVRHKLTKKYPYMEGHDKIPSHLIRNLWGQNWDHLMDDVQPYPGFRVDLNPKLKEKFGTNFTKMVRLADKYYQSIGFPELPKSFFEKSIFVESDAVNRKPDCHGTAHALHVPRSDVRVEMCGKVDSDSLFTIHHEMGHIHYYMQYANQTNIFYQGASPAFHEAVGDTIALLATTGLDHLINIGLLDTPKSEEDRAANLNKTWSDYREKMMINQLMLSALDKIPLVLFSFIIDKWTFDFYRDEIKHEELNKHWWDLVHEYQGLTTPDFETRGEEYFDIGAKYHVAHLRYLYTRYQIARVHQFQFLDSICRHVDQTGRDMKKCNIDGKPESTKAFRDMLKKGQSVHWKQQLSELTGDHVNSKLALQYYAPLERWLDNYLEEHDVKVGWDKDGD
ncbi:angiotensin-converting enzyme-like [Symsagittifera roscoffensis]|uniref:angiotensin-converting enzyme-like n=1 Tax=Symsagittifera roscoffensis TaxID=84072 RepID=UPI00307B53B2